MKKKIILFTAIIVTTFTNAQPGTLDSTFNPGTGANDTVLTISVQNDGKIIIGGNFTYYNGMSTNKIARLNTDGTLDNTFNMGGTGFNGSVFKTTIQSDSKIIVVGNFTSFNGISTNKIARLNTDGTLDISFNIGGTVVSNGNFAASIKSTSIQSDGKIIIGGNFTSFNGISINNIARLNTDGTLDDSFVGGLYAGGDIMCISIQGDGKILFGGVSLEAAPPSSSSSSTYLYSIVRVNNNANIDYAFNPVLGSENIVNTISVQSDGKIIAAGGLFIIRLNADGSWDQSFDGDGVLVSDQVFTTSIQNDGKIIIAGVGVFGPSNIRGIARLNTDGTFDSSFNPGIGPNNNVFTTSIQSNGQIIIGGDFTSYNGIGRNRIARINGGTALANAVFEKNEMVLYPNPTKNILNLSVNDGILLYKITIVDVTGKVLLEQTEHLSTINVEKLAKGVYILTASSAGDKKYQEKFIKE